MSFRVLALLRRCCAAVILVATPMAAMAEPLPSQEALEEHFRQVVFYTDEGAVNRPKPLVRWDGPVVAQLVGDPRAVAKYRGAVEDQFRELAELTGLSFRIAKKGEPVNMGVIFLPTAEIRKRTGKPQVFCTATLRGPKAKWIIGTAIVHISTDDPARTRHCIVEEITQAMGPGNDVDPAFETMFSTSDSPARTTLSAADRIIVQALFDPRLRPGSREADAMPIAREVIAELRHEAAGR